MIGAVEKGVEAARVSTPPSGVYHGVDLRVLPKYIVFRAAMLKTQMTLQSIILGLGLLLVMLFVVSRVETAHLYSQLRAKEYILAPGVQDFTPASAQSVPDSYVRDASQEYLSLLGNFTAGNIEEQYGLLSQSMSPQLKVRFLAEVEPFKIRVKAESISETLTVTDKEIQAAGTGYYQLTALARRETYVNNEYLGHTDEAIEMVLQLMPPQSGKRWFLQINQLTRQKAETFRTKRGF